MTQINFIEKAVAHFNGQTALAEAIGYSQHAVWHALKRRKQVSPKMAAAIDRATKGRISKEELRPDVFGDGK